VSDPREEPEAKATRLGLVVRYPAENELFIDIDSQAELERFEALLKIFQEHRAQYEATPTVTPSPSGKPGHFHIVVALSRPVKDQAERIILQALLGSDTKRELIAYLVDSRSCFFEKPEATPTPEPAPTPAIPEGCPF
jgi:hypothetical protein